MLLCYSTVKQSPDYCEACQEARLATPARQLLKGTACDRPVSSHHRRSGDPCRTGGRRAVTALPTGIDAVLEVAPPAFSPVQACEIARSAFGIDAATARSLGSE